jgi:hypothetical protein
MFRYLFFFSLTILINSKTIFPWNITTSSKSTPNFSTQTTPPTTTIMETSTVLNISTTTTIEYEEETTITASVNNKSYEFQSNFSRSNDSVFVSLHSNASDMFVFINNTFTSSKYDNYPCEILFNEHSINSHKITKTQIFINFNGTFTRDLATQLGDRLIDMSDLLSTVRSMTNQNNTVETV